MNVFSFDEYQELMQWKISNMGKGGHGQYKKMAESMGLSASYLSQVVKKRKNLTEEQAIEVGEWLGFSPAEVEYFLLLVQKARANSTALVALIERRMTAVATEADGNLRSHHPDETILSETDKAMFYSSWEYGAVRAMCSISKVKVEDLSERLNLTAKRIQEIVSFLIRAGLVERGSDGILDITSKATRVDKRSAFEKLHHSNWRYRALRSIELQQKDALHFTAPISCSKKDFEKIKELIRENIREVTGVVFPSKSERVYCLNIDCFDVEKLS